MNICSAILVRNRRVREVSLLLGSPATGCRLVAPRPFPCGCSTAPWSLLSGHFCPFAGRAPCCSATKAQRAAMATSSDDWTHIARLSLFEASDAASPAHMTLLHTSTASRAVRREVVDAKQPSLADRVPARLSVKDAASLALVEADVRHGADYAVSRLRCGCSPLKFERVAPLRVLLSLLESSATAHHHGRGRESEKYCLRELERNLARSRFLAQPCRMHE